MKTILSFVAIIAMVLTSSFTISVQENLNKESSEGCFNYLRVHRQGKAGVSINWAVNAPNIVQFSVEKSYDGDFYENSATVNFTGASGYKTMDNDIFPGYIHYRIVALKNDGTTECSSVETVRIVERH